MANDRISQEPVEAVILPTSGKARTSQEAVEAVILPTDAKARTSQLAVEAIVENIVAAGTKMRAYVID